MKRLSGFRSADAAGTHGTDAGAGWLRACVVALALIASSAPAWAGDGVERPRTAPAQRIGVFTGEYVDGVPVYRLPPLTVTADRRIAASPERRVASAKQPNAKAAARRGV